MPTYFFLWLSHTSGPWLCEFLTNARAKRGRQQVPRQYDVEQNVVWTQTNPRGHRKSASLMLHWKPAFYHTMSVHRSDRTPVHCHHGLRSAHETNTQGGSLAGPLFGRACVAGATQTVWDRDCLLPTFLRPCCDCLCAECFGLCEHRFSQVQVLDKIDCASFK